MQRLHSRNDSEWSSVRYRYLGDSIRGFIGIYVERSHSCLIIIKLLNLIRITYLIIVYNYKVITYIIF